MKPPVVQLDEPEEGSRVRVGAVLGGVLVVLLVGALAWLASDVPAAPDNTSPLRDAMQLRQVWASSPPASAAAVEPVAQPASAPGAVPPGYLDVCGMGLVKESEWMGQARIEAMAGSLEQVRKRVVAALKARGDEASRAAAFTLEAFGGDVQFDEPVPCEGAGCPAVPERVPSMQSIRQRMAANSDSRDQLARLAVGTRDPELYALAYGICATHGREDANSACRMLSAEQWARLDPGNGVPWLAVAEQAKARGDRGGVAEALHRVGVATSMDAHMGSLSRRLSDHMLDGAPPLESFELVMQAFTIQFPSLGGYSTLTSECTAQAVRDPNRLQQCAALADTLWTHGTNLFDWNIALALGPRVGWSPERLQAARDERDALMQAAATVGREQTVSCEAIERQTQYLGSVGRLGEIGAMRERLRASGRSIADLAREGREARAALVRSADAAPSVPLVR